MIALAKRTFLPLAALVFGFTGLAQTWERPPVSPEVDPSRHVTFRIRAPKANAVQLATPGDITILGPAQACPLTKGSNGVWEVEIGPVRPGAYRYRFTVDGVPVVDPVNPATSESNQNVWSLVQVPGADWEDTKDVPHGAVSEVTYWSSTLKRFRRCHVYTPPGYEQGAGKFPVFYLLHGATDSDDSWGSVGRAGFILDNLIAAGKASPMVVVMPHGHTGPFVFGQPFAADFETEFAADLMPQMEQRYRVYTDRPHRAIAGLSMGGAQTLNIGFAHPDKFSAMGVYSSGIFGIVGVGRSSQPSGATFEQRNKAVLDDASFKTGLKLFWFATGRDDRLVETTRATVEMFRKHGFTPVYKETDGGHTWDNWREYLNEFAPQLFK
jgi:enterochelin esterase family protein